MLASRILQSKSLSTNEVMTRTRAPSSQVTNPIQVGIFGPTVPEKLSCLALRAFEVFEAPAMKSVAPEDVAGSVHRKDKSQCLGNMRCRSEGVVLVAL